MDFISTRVPYCAMTTAGGAVQRGSLLLPLCGFEPAVLLFIYPSPLKESKTRRRKKDDPFQKDRRAAGMGKIYILGMVLLEICHCEFLRYVAYFPHFRTNIYKICKINMNFIKKNYVTKVSNPDYNKLLIQFNSIFCACVFVAVCDCL